MFWNVVISFSNCVKTVFIIWKTNFDRMNLFSQKAMTFDTATLVLMFSIDLNLFKNYCFSISCFLSILIKVGFLKFDNPSSHIWFVWDKKTPWSDAEYLAFMCSIDLKTFKMFVCFSIFMIFIIFCKNLFLYFWKLCFVHMNLLRPAINILRCREPCIYGVARF